MYSNDIDDVLITDTRVLPSKIRLIDSREEIPQEDKNKITDPNTAHRLRIETGLDLIMVSKESDPPVVKLINYGKFKYDQQRQQKKIAKSQRDNSKKVKEFYFGIMIGDHDFQTKLNQIEKALNKGYLVRIGVKNNRDTRMSLQRYQTLSQLAQQDDFILRNAVDYFGEDVCAGDMKISDRVVTMDLRRNNP